MKTLSPEFQEAFIEECLARGMGKHATVTLLQHAVTTELLEKDPDFREGFLKRAEGETSMTPNTTAGNVLNPGVADTAMGTLAGAVLGRIGGRFTGNLFKKVAPGLSSGLGKMFGAGGSMIGNTWKTKLPAALLRNSATIGGAVLGGRVAGGLGQSMRQSAIEAPTNTVNLPTWMLQQHSDTASAASKDPMKYRYGYRPPEALGKGDSKGGMGLQSPQLPEALTSAKSKLTELDTSISDLQKKMQESGGTRGLNNDLDSYHMRQDLDKLMATRKERGAGYDLLRKGFEGDKQRTMDDLATRYNTGAGVLDSTNEQAGDMGNWLNKSNPHTFRGWVADQWGRLNGVPERASRLAAQRKNIGEQQNDLKRFYDQVSGLNIQ